MKISRILEGLVEQEGTLTKELIDAIFQIDQAIGHLDIIRQRLEKNPGDAQPGVPDIIAKTIDRLHDVAGRLEKLRGKVL